MGHPRVPASVCVATLSGVRPRRLAVAQLSDWRATFVAPCGAQRLLTPAAMVDRGRPAAAYLALHFVRPRTSVAQAQAGRVPCASDATIRPRFRRRGRWPTE